MDAIGDWLEAHGLGKYTGVLVENEVDMRVLSRLSEADLVALGLPLGARRKLQAAIETLAREESPRVLTSARDPAPRDAPERRQLTVMFCDLVDSVRLGERLDVEDYRDLLAAFRGAVVEAVERYGGFVARHQGDGLLAYFGYPQAHEDDAECAVHSGLAVVRGVETLEHAHGARLRARVGIATGPAVVGDVLSTGASERAELAALGPTPNLAARLQGEAQPGGVLISENTRALTAGFFELEALPARTLRGISDRLTPYRVRGEAAGRSRFAARSGTRLSRFVAREEELESLARRWARVRQGRGQVVLMLGEAGIGKSRLVHQLRESAATEPHARQYRDHLLRLHDTAVRSGLTLGARAIAAALGGHWPGAALHSPTATGGDRRRR